MPCVFVIGEPQPAHYSPDLRYKTLLRLESSGGHHKKRATLVSPDCGVVQNRRNPVFPSMISAPRPNGSVLDCLRWNFTILGFWRSSTVMSPQARWSLGSKSDSLVSSSSPRRKKPKKAVQETAHNTRRSGSADRSNSSRMSRSRGAVIGRRILEGRPRPMRDRLIPAMPAPS